jgi:hypothetical protein
LTVFFQNQVQQRPELPEGHFWNVVYSAADVDVLLITGMRDNTPVAAFSYLAPDSKLVEIRVQASEETCHVHRGCHGGDGTNRNKENKDSKHSRAGKDSNVNNDNKDSKHSKNSKHNTKVNGRSKSTAWDYHPSPVFDNNTNGSEATNMFA